MNSTDSVSSPADRLEAGGPDVVVIRDAPPEVIGGGVDADGNAPRTRRAGLLLVAGLVLLALVAALAVLLSQGDDEVATQPAARTQPEAPIAQSNEPRITIEAPASVVAGEPADFTVNYELAAGRFSGSIEEWGDGIGAGSVKQERCSSTAQTSGPSKGRYSVSHTWTKPGTYDVVLGVNTYTCVGTESTQAKASRTLTVTVAP